jgi:hypothetical protein
MPRVGVASDLAGEGVLVLSLLPDETAVELETGGSLEAEDRLDIAGHLLFRYINLDDSSIHE